MGEPRENPTILGEFYYRNGDQIKGVYKSSDSELLGIEKDVLNELLRKNKICDELIKRDAERMQAIMSGNETAQHPEDTYEKLKDELAEANLKIADLQEQLKKSSTKITSYTFAEYTHKLALKSAEARRLKGLETDALTLSLTLRGFKPAYIMAVLEGKGYPSSRTKLSRALSVLDAGDKKRLETLMSEFPEFFTDITHEDFNDWFNKRVKKSKKYLKNVNAVDNWGE